MNEEDKIKVLEDTVRFYAERENAEVAYITIKDGEKPVIYEEDKDRGFVAQMALSILQLPYDKEAMPNGYALVPQKTKELTEQNKKLSLGERFVHPINFYKLFFGGLGFVLAYFLGGFWFTLAFFLIVLCAYGFEVLTTRSNQ